VCSAFFVGAIAKLIAPVGEAEKLATPTFKKLVEKHVKKLVGKHREPCTPPPVTPRVVKMPVLKPLPSVVKPEPGVVQPEPGVVKPDPENMEPEPVAIKAEAKYDVLRERAAPRIFAEWDFESGNAVLFRKGVRVFAHQLVQNEPKKGRASTVDAVFLVDGQTLQFKVKNAWWGIATPPAPDSSKTPVVRPFGERKRLLDCRLKKLFTVARLLCPF
jgi:hypothetical protein